MTILVMGATGSVGKEVLARLVATGVKARGMTRYSAKMDGFPEGAEGCVGDLVAMGSLGKPLSGVEQVFMMTPLSQNEIQAGRNAITAAKMAGVKKIVYMSEPQPAGSEQIPHFRNKQLIEKALKQSEISYTVLRSNNFFQNDLWGQAALMNYNTYPQPLGNIGLSRVDSRDVADAAVNALLNDGFENQEFAINGPDVLTGDSIAEEFSRQLGREIRYAGDDLEAWAKQSQHMMPAWMVEDFKLMYAYFQEHGLKASQQELDKQEAIIGHAPRKFSDFVSELLQAWSQN